MQKHCHFPVTVLILAAMVLITACGRPRETVKYSALSDRLDFNRDLWRYDAGKDQKSLWETREFMMDDLLNNHLSYGMNKNEILTLLGPTYMEPGVHYTWKPSPMDTNRAAYQIYRDSLRIFTVYRNEMKSPLLRYNVGYTQYGPNMFIVVLDRSGNLADVLTTVAISPQGSGN